MLAAQPRSSGAFNNSWLAKVRDKQLGLVTWNARTLLHHDSEIFKMKKDFLSNIMGSADVILIQESHGSIPDIDIFLHHEQAHFHIFFSPGPNRGTAGLITMISKSATVGATFQNIIYEDGRIMPTKTAFDDFTFAIANVHNYNISLPQLQFLLSDAQETRDDSLRSPLHSSSFSGGFEFPRAR